MEDFETALAARLREHEEKMRRHRDIVEQQRKWLLQSTAVTASTPVTVPPVSMTGESPESNRNTAVAASPNRDDVRKQCVVDRLLQKGEEAKKRREQQRELAERGKLEKELQEMSVRPTNRTTCTPTAIAMQHPATKKVDLQTAVATWHPQISLTSEKIALDKRQREHTEFMTIEDSLLARSEQSKADKWMRAKFLAHTENTGTPKITSIAKTLNRNEDVALRLYEGARNSAHATASSKEELKNLIEDCIDATFTPVISDKARRLQRRDGHSVSNDLYQQAKVQQQFRKEIQASALSNDCKAKPHIDPVSDLIATQLAQSVTERLTAPKNNSTQVTRSSFKPRISKASERLALYRRGEHNDEPFFETLHKESYLRQVKNEQRKRLLEEERVRDCTFAPNVGTSAHSKHPTDSFVERAQKWEQRRQQQLESVAERCHEESIKECTFSPRIAHTSSRTKSPSLLYGGDGHAWGFHEYIDRQDQARLQRLEAAEAEALAFSTGSRWQNKRTVPQAPHLSCFETSYAKQSNGAAANNAVRSAYDALVHAEEASLL